MPKTKPLGAPADDSSISDAEFIRYLFMREYDYVRSVVYSIVQSYEISEDIAQETFVQALMHIDKVRIHSKPQGWLVITAKNLVGRHYRAEQKQIKAQGAAVGMPLSNSPIDKRLRLLEELSEEDRQLIHMRFIETLSVQEIAKQFGIKDNTASKRIARACERLKKIAIARRKINFFLLMCQILPLGWH